MNAAVLHEVMYDIWRQKHYPRQDTITGIIAAILVISFIASIVSIWWYDEWFKIVLTVVLAFVLFVVALKLISNVQINKYLEQL